MTVPKFRAWDTVKRAMNEVQAVVYTDEKVYPIYSKEVRRYVPFSEAVLMQSTGLFDSSLEPVEIYKDDIVTKSLPNGAVLVGVVTFNKGMFLVDGVEAIDQSWVVIGNIHEHPHLLEGLNSG